MKHLFLRFELGAALFIGWGGSCLVICGSAVMWLGRVVSGYMWKCSHVLFLWERVIPQKV